MASAMSPSKDPAAMMGRLARVSGTASAASASMAWRNSRMPVPLAAEMRTGGRPAMAPSRSAMSSAAAAPEPVHLVDGEHRGLVATHLIERGREGFDQLVRQRLDEPHGVGDDDPPSAGQSQQPGGGVERGEEKIVREDGGVGEAVEQRGLAGVGVAHQRAGGQWHRRARCASRGALPLDLSEALAQAAQLLVDEAAVDLDLLLTHAATHAAGADATALAFEVRPPTGEARELVLQLGHLHLDASLRGAGAAREDGQDHLGAVENRYAPALLEVALLARRELVVDQRRGAAELPDAGAEGLDGA